MKIALIQQSASESKAANLEKGLIAVKEAAINGTNIICFAELAFTKFYPQNPSGNNNLKLAESAATIHRGIGAESERVGNQHRFTAPYDCYATLDGWVVVGTASNKLFRRLCVAIGRPELADAQDYRSHRSRSRRRETVNGFVAEWMRERSCDAALAALGPEAADLPCARVESPHELVNDPQLIARGMIERYSHPELGEIVFHGNPLRFSDAEPRERALAPVLGADNAEVLGEVGVGADELARLADEGVV